MGAFFELILGQYHLTTSRYYAACMILTVERAQHNWKIPRNALREEALMVEYIEKHKETINKDVVDSTNFLHFALVHFKEIVNKRLITLERISVIIQEWPYIYDNIQLSDKATMSFIKFLRSESFLNCKTSPQKTCQALISSWNSKNNELEKNHGVYVKDNLYEPVDDFDFDFSLDDPLFDI